jgi:hypothetical protein
VGICFSLIAYKWGGGGGVIFMQSNLFAENTAWKSNIISSIE